MPLGYFCSAGACYSTEGRPTCISSRQCPQGDRCDRRANFCVPDVGGCDLCTDDPELCCHPDEETCDEATRHCVVMGIPDAGP
ncbi:MAG: hypothetical protein AB2A00_19250 [Myxococcota bacterium]